MNTTKKKSKSTTKKSPAKESGTKRLDSIEKRLAAVEEFIHWQPNQPPGHEPAPMSNGAH